jgi:hypothetical protein
MKKLFIIIVMCFLLPIFSSAEELVLDTPKPISTPEISSYDWEAIIINRDDKTLVVRYNSLDSNGDKITFSNGRQLKSYVCQNIPDDPGTDVNDCVSEGEPYACCTGFGTGNCDESDPCFDDIFGFEIRTQDVGTKIGIGLRNLIKNKFKNSVIGAGNDGSFDD